MSLLFFPAGISVIPQNDFDTNPTENGGWEATQSFLVEKSKITRGGALDRLFTRGVSIAVIDPKCPPPYHFLKLKLFVVTDHAPGVSKIACTFTGYANESTNGSSGEEISVETYSLRGTLEDCPVTEHPKFIALEPVEQSSLGMLINGQVQYVQDPFDSLWWLYWPRSESGSNKIPADEQLTSDDAKWFARLIANSRNTYKKASWTYTVRSEGSKGFTAAQLNTLGKIVENPPGEPEKPTAGYTWMMVGPDQTQSGEKRFIKDIQFALIEKNDENTFLYGP